MRVTGLSDVGGVSLEGVDLRSVSSADAAAIMQLFDEEGLIVVRGQTLSPSELAAATEFFGGLELKPVVDNTDPNMPGVAILSSRGAEGDLKPEHQDAMIGFVDWHTDEAYLPRPNRGKLLYSVVIPPEGGLTGFIDGRRTWAALPDALKQRIKGLHVVQSWRHANESIRRNRDLYKDNGMDLADDRFPDVAYPIVRVHPRTGHKSLNIPPIFASRILELPGEEGRLLLRILFDHMLQPEFAYWHHYSSGDLVAWDNWRFIHAGSGTPGRYLRTLWQTVIRGGPEVGRLLTVKEALT
jgi:taurine dioxygenase